MIFGVMLTEDGEEEHSLCRYLHELTAYHTEEKLELSRFADSRQLERELEKANLLDVAVVDVTLPGALEAARRIRERFRKAELLLIADGTISPMAYMNPSIRASSLLLKPIKGRWKDTVWDFYVRLLQENKEKNTEDVLWVENRSGIFRIPLEQVYYIEAREKKVFIRTRTEEYGTNETIEHLSGQLPAGFRRCHRSFIVNTAYISRIRLSEKLLYLGEKMFVPVSRSYQREFKRYPNE